MKMSLFVCVAATFLLTGCFSSTDPYTGERYASNAAVGAGTGALIGAGTGLLFRDPIGGLVGGALIGGGVGLIMDNQENAERRRRYRYRRRPVYYYD